MKNELWDEYYKQIKPLNLEICAINRKYNFQPLESRSEEDNKRYKELYERIDWIRKKINYKHRIGPCPECGFTRTASSGGICINKPNCKLATLLYL